MFINVHISPVFFFCKKWPVKRSTLRPRPAMLPKHVGFGVSPDELSFHESHKWLLPIATNDGYYWLVLKIISIVIVFHRTQGPKTTVKTESSVLLHGCFLATVSSSKHQQFDPSMTLPCINCGPCIPYTLKRTKLQPPTYPSTLKFAKLLFVPSLLQVAALRTTSQRKDSTEHLEIPRIFREDSGTCTQLDCA